jgi:hypothetical protein
LHQLAGAKRLLSIGDKKRFQRGSIEIK